MAENRVKDFINTVDLVKEQMIQKKEISTIAVAVKLEGLDQVNEELDKMLNKLEKANSLADELTSKLKNELDLEKSVFLIKLLSSLFEVSIPSRSRL